MYHMLPHPEATAQHANPLRGPLKFRLAARVQAG
jgi:hypothetical protein